jgi:hypothetical protein
MEWTPDGDLWLHSVASGPAPLIASVRGIDSTAVAMNFFRKHDRIRSPYSTILALVSVSALGLYFVVWSHETGLLGVGVIVGGFAAIVMKAAAEASDRETWQRLRSFFGGNHDDGSR